MAGYPLVQSPIALIKFVGFIINDTLSSAKSDDPRFHANILRFRVFPPTTTLELLETGRIALDIRLKTVSRPVMPSDYIISMP